MTVPAAVPASFTPPSTPAGAPDRPWFAHYGAVPRSLAPYPDLSLGACVRRAAERWRDRPALTFYGATTSFAELDRHVERFAAALQALGVRRGDRVALMLPNCPQFVVAFYGALRAGAIAVGINPLYTPRELAHVLRDSEAAVFVALAPMLRAYDAIDGATPVRHVVVASLEDAMPAAVAAGYVAKARAEGTYVEAPRRAGLHHFAPLLENAPNEATPVPVDPAREVAVLQYTGGTTGTSKGAMLTHRNLVANCLQTRAASPQLRDGEEVTIAVLPFFHIYGLTVVLNMSVVSGGATLVVLPRFDAGEVLAAVARARATVLPMVPSMYVALNAALTAAEAGAAEGTAAPDLSSLRLANAGGAALPPEVGREFERRVGIPVHEGYGLSEASPVTHFNPGWLPPREGTVGLAVPDVDAKVVDADGRRVAPGAVGELCVRGPNVMLGYWNRADETARALRPGPADEADDGFGGPGPWLHTGDLARVEPDGYTRIVDRAKDMLLVGGYNVYPREVEEVLYEHPAVLEAAAYGVPDAYLGEVARAAVVLRPGADATAAALAAFCAERLAPYKRPRVVEVRDALPKSTVGKLLRRVLRDEAAAAAAPNAATPNDAAAPGAAAGPTSHAPPTPA